MCDPFFFVPLDGVGVSDSLSYEKVSIEILDQQVCRLHANKVISVIVLWRNEMREEATWQAEEEMKSRYPFLFPTPKNHARGCIFLRIFVF